MVSSFILAIGCILMYKFFGVWYAYYQLMKQAEDTMFQDEAVFKVAIYKNFFQLRPIFEEYELKYLTYSSAKGSKDVTRLIKYLVIKYLEEDIIELQMLQGRYVLDNKNPTMKTCLDEKVVDLQVILDELISMKESLQAKQILNEGDVQR